MPVASPGACDGSHGVDPRTSTRGPRVRQCAGSGGALRTLLETDASTVLAMAVGAVIGTAGATFFVAQSGEPESALPYGRRTPRASRSWSGR